MHGKNLTFCKSQRDAYTHKMSRQSEVIKVVKSAKNRFFRHFEFMDFNVAICFSQDGHLFYVLAFKSYNEKVIF